MQTGVAFSSTMGEVQSSLSQKVQDQSSVFKSKPLYQTWLHVGELV